MSVQTARNTRASLVSRLVAAQRVENRDDITEHRVRTLRAAIADCNRVIAIGR